METTHLVLSRIDAPQASWSARILAALALASLAFDALPPLPGVYCPLPEFLSLPLVPICAFLMLRLWRRNGFSAFRDLASADGTVADCVVMALFALYVVLNSAARLPDPATLATRAAAGFTPGFRPTMNEVILGFSLYFVLRTHRVWSGSFFRGIDWVTLIARWYPVLFLYAGIESLGRLWDPLYRFLVPIKLATNGILLPGLQGFSVEPSWFSLQLLFYLPWLFAARSHGSISRGMFVRRILLIIFVALASLSILCVLYTTLFLLYRLIRSRNWRGLLATGAAILVLVIGLGLVLRFSTTENIKLRRFESLYRLDFQGFLRYSGSEMIRLYFPLMGFRELAQNPLFGVGGHESPRYLAQMIVNDYPWMFVGTEEISGYIEKTPSYLGPRNFVARIAGENGLLGLVSLCLLAALWIRRILRLGNPAQRQLGWDILIVMVLSGLQFDNYHSFSFWCGAALLGLLRDRS